MRAKEVLYEDYSQRLDSDLNNLLMNAKGNGAQELPTEAFVNELLNMGYAVTVESLMALLQDNPSVANVTPQSISFASSEVAMGDDPTQDSAAKVKDMARKAVDIG